MKKNFGSAIVKKAISIAMACMLIFATPVAYVQAADVSVNQLESLTSGMTDDEKDLVENISTDLQTKVDGTQGPEKAINDVYNVGEKNVNEACDKSVNKSEAAAKDAVDAKEAGEKALNSAESYVKELEKIIKEDNEYVGNDVVYCIDYLPENKNNDVKDPYTNCADIKINVTDKDGNVSKESLVEYTDNMAKEANAAADKAKEIANNITADTNIAEASANLEAAREAANTAMANAETAYNSAVVSLDAEILVYNSLIAAYYPADEAKLYFKANSKGDTPVSSDVTKMLMSKTEMDEAFLTNLDAQAKIISDAERLVHDCELFTLTTAREAVETVKVTDENFVKTMLGVVEQCELALEGCNNLDPNSEDYQKLQNQLMEARKIAADYFASMKNDSDKFIEENPTSVQAGYAEALSYFIGETQKHLEDFEPEDDELKIKLTNFFETINTGANAILTWYTKRDSDHPNDLCPQESVHYAIDTANKLIVNLVGDVETQYDGIIGEADKKIDDAAVVYSEAAEAYKKAQEAYKKANIFERFTTLKAKLDAAEADLIQAKADFDAAIKDKEIIEDAKKSFDDEVKKLTDSDNTDTPGNTPNTNNTPGTNTTPDNNNNGNASENGTVPGNNGASNNSTSDNGNVPGSDNSGNTPVATNITDDPTALSDAPSIATMSDSGEALDVVPKTGDNLPASVPFACASLVAFMSAAFINLKRRFTR